LRISTLLQRKIRLGRRTAGAVALAVVNGRAQAPGLANPKL
jgi:hypothetical protein